MDNKAITTVPVAVFATLIPAIEVFAKTPIFRKAVFSNSCKIEDKVKGAL